MAESSGGKMEPLSKWDTQEELKCISCAASISPAFKVRPPFSGTLQQKCINSQCGAALIPGANLCVKCAAPQYLVCLECGAHQHTQNSRQQPPSQVDQPSSDPHTTQPPLQVDQLSSDLHTTQPPLQVDQPSHDQHTNHPPPQASPDPHTTQSSPQASSDPYTTHPQLQASPEADLCTTQPPLQASPDVHTTQFPAPISSSDMYTTQPLPDPHTTQPPLQVDQTSRDPCISQAPDDLSSNCSQSGISAIPLEASLEEENSPPLVSPRSSFSVEEKNNTEGDISNYLSPPQSTIIFNPPRNKAIDIYFKAVLCKTAWEWDNNSSVFIHFNQLNVDVGPGFCTCVDVDKDLLLVEFDVKMHIDEFLRYKYIFYKYVVHSRRKEEVKHPYEYLYGAYIEGVADTRFISRALKIDNSKCFPGGEKCKVITYRMFCVIRIHVCMYTYNTTLQA